MPHENAARKARQPHTVEGVDGDAAAHDPMDLTSPEWEAKFRRIRRTRLRLQGETPEDIVETGLGDSRDRP